MRGTTLRCAHTLRAWDHCQYPAIRESSLMTTAQYHHHHHHHRTKRSVGRRSGERERGGLTAEELVFVILLGLEIRRSLLQHILEHLRGTTVFASTTTLRQVTFLEQAAARHLSLISHNFPIQYHDREQPTQLLSSSKSGEIGRRQMHCLDDML